MPNRPSPQPDPTYAPAQGPEPSFKLIDLATLALLVPVLLPLVVVFSQVLYFESDPRNPGAQAAETITFGPAGSAFLATACVAIAALVMLVAAFAGAKIRWCSSALIAAGIVPCLIVMPEHFTSRMHTGAWIAAASLGLAAAHLAQFPRAKRIILTALIALALPLFIQGAWYVYVEHPATVQSFMANEQQSIESRGLAFGSTEHAKYLTRLKGNDVIGAVGMSNVLGSIVAAITLLSVFVFTLSAWRKLGKGYLAATAGLTCLAAWALVLTQSKGAMLALIGTAGFALCVYGLTRIKPSARRAIPALCVVFVLMGSAAVLLRGAAGPPDDHTGERSLLFRYHYAQGAAKILLNDPAAMLLGVGPGQFKNRYEAVRNPISPEVVSSTHSVFVDYIAMLGLGGIAWSLLLIAWMFNAGKVAGRDAASLQSHDRGPPADKPFKLFALLAAIVFGIQYYVQLPGLYAETAILWLVGAVGFILIAAYVVYPVWFVSRAWGNLAAAFAACMLMLHAQIEMTFFWTSAAAFMWVVAATASASPCENPRLQASRAWPRFIPALVLVILAVVMLITHAQPVARHQSHLAKAADLLRTVGPPAAITELDQAAAVIANDPTTTRWRIRLREEIAIALKANSQPDAAAQYLNQALAVSEQAQQAGLDGLTAARRQGILALSAFYITDNRAWLTRAQSAYKTTTQLSPHGLNDHVRLADTSWLLSDFDTAQAAYRRALEISDQYFLDPDTQLPDPERKRINARLTDNADDVTP